MSQLNVETLKRGLEAYNRRDAEAMLEDRTPRWSGTRRFW